MNTTDAALAWFDASYRESDAIDDARQLGHADNSDQAAVSATAGRILAAEVIRLRAEAIAERLKLEGAGKIMVIQWKRIKELEKLALLSDPRFRETWPNIVTDPTTGFSFTI